MLAELWSVEAVPSVVLHDNMCMCDLLISHPAIQFGPDVQGACPCYGHGRENSLAAAR